MALLDIEKAFDKVWIDGVIYKMIQYGYPTTLIKFINSYLRNRHLIVKVEDALSSKRRIGAGVPQGSVLGPKLFTIFVNDIPMFGKTKTALFADDLAIYSHSFSAIVAAKQIQMHIHLLEEFYDKWKIKVNKTKTEVIVFARKKNDIKIFQNIKVYGHPITPSHTVKYLGVYLDSKLTYYRHTTHIIQKAHAVIKKLYPLLLSNSALSITNKKLIYKMLIRPIMTYATPVWCSMAKTHIKKLQIIQNKCLRLILSASNYTRLTELHARSDVQYFEDHVKDLAERFYTNQLKCNNLLLNITDIRSYNLPFEYRYKLPYDKLLIFNSFKD